MVSALEGDEGRQVRLKYGLPPEPLIPVYVRFRQFAERIHAAGLAGLEGRVGLLADFLTAELQAGLAGEILLRETALRMAASLLESSNSLFLFDGLDEVADGKMRVRLLEAVSDLINSYKRPRVVLTSRPYAFRRDLAPLELALFEPLPLDREGRRAFAHQWYRAVRSTPVAPLTAEDAAAGADSLARAADALPELAEVPLLLSILALVHFNRHGLPLERATLYDHATLAMLGHWERDPAGRGLGDDAVPADWEGRLDLSEQEIRTVVEHLAQHIQIDAGGGEFSRAVGVEQLTAGLEALSASRGATASERGELLLKLLVERSGLLLERSPDVFAFAHLSFQEYPAAQWLVKQGQSGVEKIARLSADERHTEVCRFATRILSGEENGSARVTKLVTSIAVHSAALAAACLLETPGIQLDAPLGERLALEAFAECTDHRRYYATRIVARLIWALLKSSPSADNILLKILSSADEDFERHFFRGRPRRHRKDLEYRHFRDHTSHLSPAFGVLALREAGPLAPGLSWVLRRLSALTEGEVGPLERAVAEFLLVEGGEAEARDHIRALIHLLATDDRYSRRASVSSLVRPRAERLLSALWADLETRPAVVQALEDSLVWNHEFEPDGGRTRVWAAAKYLLMRGTFCAELPQAVVEAGLYIDAAEARASLQQLAGDPISRSATLNALGQGLQHSNSNIRAECIRTLLTLGLLPPAVTGNPDDEELLQAKLSDPTTKADTISLLAEELWSEEPAGAWQAARLLIDTGNISVPGLAQVVVHSGIVADRASAIAYLERLHNDWAASLSVRGALLSGLANSSDRIATSSALLLLRLGETNNPSRLKRIIRSALRDKEQVDDVYACVRQLLQTPELKATVLEGLTERLREKPAGPIGSAAARLMASERSRAVHDLAELLVEHGLPQVSDHPEILEYLKGMMEDPDTSTSTRRALVAGLSSDVQNVAWGAATALWEFGSRTIQQLPAVLATTGLGVAERRDRARAWLLELLARPRVSGWARKALEEAASRVLNVSRGSPRNHEHAWAIAQCLVAGGALHAENLALALVIGGFQQRADHGRVLDLLQDCIRKNAEFATEIEPALWTALEDTNADVRWGAARTLIARGAIDPRSVKRPIDDDDGDKTERFGAYGRDQRIKALANLWRVLIGESATEPMAASVLHDLTREPETDSLEREGLVKLTEGENPDVACAAAYLLLDQANDDLPVACEALIKYGLTTTIVVQTPACGWTTRQLHHQLLLSCSMRQITCCGEQTMLPHGQRLCTCLITDGRQTRAFCELLVFGGLSYRYAREAEKRLREHLADPGFRGDAINALNVTLYAEHDTPTVAVKLLVEAGAPLDERIISALDDIAVWQPWVPLALLAMTGRAAEARTAVGRVADSVLTDLIGELPS